MNEIKRIAFLQGVGFLPLRNGGLSSPHCTSGRCQSHSISLTGLILKLTFPSTKLERGVWAFFSSQLLFPLQLPINQSEGRDLRMMVLDVQRKKGKTISKQQIAFSVA